jgi:hypothetical protein
VRVFSDFNDAIKFVDNNKLVKCKKQSYGDTAYYRNGYYDMEIQDYEIN